MKYSTVTRTIAFMFLLQSPAAIADIELIYKEEEPGVDAYLSKFSINDRYIRIDDLSDDSGFVIYDDHQRTVFSVSHYDRSVLVIKQDDFEVPEMSTKLVTSDKPLEGAPRIAGKVVNDYRVELKSDNIEEMCTHIQYVPGLLEETGDLLHAYTRTLAGNHAKTLDQVPAEYQTPCMLSDQVYFDGEIYSKGLPVMEWRSNGRKRYLQNYREVKLEDKLFELPADYRRISLGQGH